MATHISHNPTAAFLSGSFTFLCRGQYNLSSQLTYEWCERVDSFNANAQVVSTFFFLFHIVLAQPFGFNKNALTFLTTERPQEVEERLLRAVEG